MNEIYTSSRYTPPTREYLTKKRKEFDSMVGGFANYTRLQKTDFKPDIKIVDEISTRLYQRMTYYMFFHGKELEQTRQAGVKAYWILRYHPLKVIEWKEEYNVNVYFAFYVLFVTTIVEQIPTLSSENQRKVINEIRTVHEKDFLRSLNEYDIGKEAMMLISESISNIVRYEISKL